MQHHDTSWKRPGLNPGPWGYQAVRIDHRDCHSSGCGIFKVDIMSIFMIGIIHPQGPTPNHPAATNRTPQQAAEPAVQKGDRQTYLGLGLGRKLQLRQRPPAGCNAPRSSLPKQSLRMATQKSAAAGAAPRAAACAAAVSARPQHRRVRRRVSGRSRPPQLPHRQTASAAPPRLRPTQQRPT